MFLFCCFVVLICWVSGLLPLVWVGLVVLMFVRICGFAFDFDLGLVTFG